MINTIVVNLWGTSGSGKSVMAADIFSHLKKQGFNAEIVTEYAKELVWQGHFNVLEDQLYLISKQSRRIRKIDGKVDVIVTDSPLPLTCVYGRYYKSKGYNQYFDDYVMGVFNEFTNLNFYLQRGDFDYQKEGRYQDEDESNIIAQKVLDFMSDRKIPYYTVKSGEEVSFSNIMQRIRNLVT